ncbi:DUF3427 domain-containing protein [Brevibacillus laterosporus]|uniref:DUF3427 domain-containing protein n=1 Tax=Brevibacillus laterosporus TaxID=1465 RepID=UPI0030B9E4BA
MNQKVSNLGKKAFEIDNPKCYDSFKNLVLSKICKFVSDQKDIKISIIETLIEFQKLYKFNGWINYKEVEKLNTIASESSKLVKRNEELKELYQREKDLREVLENALSEYKNFFSLKEKSTVNNKKENELEVLEKEMETLKNKYELLLKQLKFILKVELYNTYTRNELIVIFQSSAKMGSWREGVCRVNNHYLFFVTLKKDAKNTAEHLQYHDYFIDKNHFHWQSANQTSHHSDRGQDYINHGERDIHIHLFVRKFTEMHGKTLPFTYLGELDYVRSVGDKPMNITWKLHNALPDDLYLDLVR